MSFAGYIAFAMIYNYFKIAVRSLLKSRYYTLINIGGLAFGLTCVLLILQYLRAELGYDRFHADADRIYRVIWAGDNPQTRTPHPLAQAMVQDFADVESAVSLTPIWGPGLTRETLSVRNLKKDIRYEESAVLAVDSTFFEVFNFKLLQGKADVLKQPTGILLSASAARRYFGDENPIGQQLAINDDRFLLEVTGVFEDVPATSHVHFDFLVSYVMRKAMAGPDDGFYTWGDFGHYNYIKVKPGTDVQQLEASMLPWIQKYVDWSAADFRYLTERGYGFRLQPLTDIHLHSHVRWELETNGNIDYIYMMAAAAVLILLMACINFINLSTAKSLERAREIGIRKSLGALRRQLMLQFTGESVLVAMVALVVAVVLIELVQPFFFYLTGQHLSLRIQDVLIMLLGLGVGVGILAGLYPSWILSGVQPTTVLKGKLIQGPRGGRLRRALTVFQFAAGMFLISASAVIYFQLKALREHALGFAQDEVLVMPLKNRDMFREHGEALLESLRGVPGVTSVAAMSNIPGKSFNQDAIAAVTNPTHRVDVSEMWVDEEALPALGLTLAAGRNFRRDNAADLSSSFILNEAAAKALQLQQPIGQELLWDADGGEVRGNVIGVVKDFHFQSLHQQVKPLMIRLSHGGGFNYIIARLNIQSMPATLSGMEQVWKKFDERFAFEHYFMSDNIQQQYVAEQRMEQVLLTFAAIAVATACMGLLGMAALTFRNRIKEVSVRKIHGAGVGELMVLLVKDFSILILIAIVVAVPLAWGVMHRWLENFSYHIRIHPAIFILSGLALLVLSWLMLAYLTLRTTRVNPAVTLRSE